MTLEAKLGCAILEQSTQYPLAEGSNSATDTQRGKMEINTLEERLHYVCACENAP